MFKSFPLAMATAALAAAGCGGPPTATRSPAAPGTAPAGARAAAIAVEGDEVSAERAKLTPEDRALVEAQEWCAVNGDSRLGSMGPPLKLDVKGRPVFVCCKGCKKKAEADPDNTLAKVEELKTKTKAERDANQ